MSVDMGRTIEFDTSGWFGGRDHNLFRSLKGRRFSVDADGLLTEVFRPTRNSDSRTVRRYDMNYREVKEGPRGNLYVEVFDQRNGTGKKIKPTTISVPSSSYHFVE